jgi:hypothetical protein
MKNRRDFLKIGGVISVGAFIAPFISCKKPFLRPFTYITGSLTGSLTGSYSGSLTGSYSGSWDTITGSMNYSQSFEK